MPSFTIFPQPHSCSQPAMDPDPSANESADAPPFTPEQLNWIDQLITSRQSQSSAEEHEKRGRPGLIHHVSDVRWKRGGHENDVRGRGPTANMCSAHTLMSATTITCIIIRLSTSNAEHPAQTHLKPCQMDDGFLLYLLNVECRASKPCRFEVRDCATVVT